MISYITRDTKFSYLQNTETQNFFKVWTYELQDFFEYNIRKGFDTFADLNLDELNEVAEAYYLANIDDITEDYFAEDKQLQNFELFEKLQTRVNQKIYSINRKRGEATYYEPIIEITFEYINNMFAVKINGTQHNTIYESMHIHTMYFEASECGKFVQCEELANIKILPNFVNDFILNFIHTYFIK